MIGVAIFTARVRGGRARTVGRLADRRTRGAGRRRSDRDAADADDPQRGRRPRAARRRARRVVGHRRARRRHGPARRRRGRRGDLVAVDLLAERPRRARPAPARDAAPRVARAGQGARPPRPRTRRARVCSGSSGASCTGTATAGRARRSSARSSSARSCSRRSSRGSSGRRSRCCRCGSSATARSRPRTARRCFMYFGMFGSIFLLTPVLPDRAGLLAARGRACASCRGRLMPMFVAPIAGALSDRIGGRPLMATGLALQAIGLAWIAAVSTATVGYASLVGPFILSGIGMALFFAPVANVVLSAVRPDEEGKASGANNAIREVGGVLRRRRARLDLRPLRRVRVAADVHRRARPGALGRGGGSRAGVGRSRC